MPIGKRDLQYKTLQSAYWMLYGLATAFVTVFLLSKGFSSSAIGVIVAVSNIFSAAGQMVVGTLVDKYARFTWKMLILFFCGVEFVCLMLMMIFTRSMPINGVMFPLFSVLLFFQMPLVNAALFYYTQRGEHIDFGSARGTGSVAYAVMSFIAGQMIVRFGEQSLIYIGLIMLVMFSMITISMPYYKDDDAQIKHEEKSGYNQDTRSVMEFVKAYPSFMMMCLGTILVMAFHNTIHTYMIQMMEAVGGNSATMGTAFSWEAIVELPTMFGFFILIRKISSNRLMMFAGIGFIVKAVCICMAGSVLQIYGAETLQMFGYAILATASVYYANDQVDKCDAVKGQGFMTASMSVGGVIGNFSGGFIYDALGLGSLKVVMIAFAASGALFMMLGGISGRKKEQLN